MSSRIEQALGRLDSAIKRLEQLGRGGPSTEGVADMQQLNANLEAMRADYNALQLTSLQASGRIDAAIGRLRAVLGA